MLHKEWVPGGGNLTLTTKWPEPLCFIMRKVGKEKKKKKKKKKWTLLPIKTTPLLCDVIALALPPLPVFNHLPVRTIFTSSHFVHLVRM